MNFSVVAFSCASRLVLRVLRTACLCLLAVPVAADSPRPAWTVRHLASPVSAEPAAKLLAPGSVQLLHDDGSFEAEVGLSGAAAFQFLWFQRFDSPALTVSDFRLEEIQVLFPPGPEVVPGAAVQLVVFTDADGDPTNGATLVTAFDDVIQVADGSTFSVYPLSPAPVIGQDAGDLLVGVVNRYVTSGVSPPSRPAALDTTSSAGRSWLATWAGDPPDPPSLPGGDATLLIDAFEPGNWMIRAAGSLVVVSEVPTLDPLTAAALALLLAMSALVLLRRP